MKRDMSYFCAGFRLTLADSHRISEMKLLGLHADDEE